MVEYSSRSVMQYLDTPHKMSVGLCRSIPHTNAFIVQFICITPWIPEWYILEYLGSGQSASGSETPYKVIFDSLTDMEEKLASLDVDWFEEDQALETVATHFPHHLARTSFPRLRRKVEQIFHRRSNLNDPGVPIVDSARPFGQSDP
jgi:hypothetical protein